jgi:uncharacterized protein
MSNSPTELPIEVRVNARWIHLTGAACAPIAIVLLVIPLLGAFPLSLLFPYFTWKSLREAHPFVEENGRNVMNFHGSMAVYSWIFGFVWFLVTLSACGAVGGQSGAQNGLAVTVMVGLFYLGPVVLLIQSITSLVLGIYGAKLAYKGQTYRYPFAQELFKARR